MHPETPRWSYRTVVDGADDEKGFVGSAHTRPTRTRAASSAAASWHEERQSGGDERAAGDAGVGVDQLRDAVAGQPGGGGKRGVAGLHGLERGERVVFPLRGEGGRSAREKTRISS